MARVPSGGWSDATTERSRIDEPQAHESVCVFIDGTNSRTYSYLSIGIVRCTLSDEKIALECMNAIYKYCTWVAKI